MLQDKQAKGEEKQKERRWACLHRLKEKGVAFVAGGDVERGSAGLSRNRSSDLRLDNHPLYHPEGCVCAAVEKRRCLRCRGRLDRVPARHNCLLLTMPCHVSL
jgi:hypothetical protein